MTTVTSRIEVLPVTATRPARGVRIAELRRGRVVVRPLTPVAGVRSSGLVLLPDLLL